MKQTKIMLIHHHKLPHHLVSLLGTAVLTQTKTCGKSYNSGLGGEYAHIITDAKSQLDSNEVPRLKAYL